MKPKPLLFLLFLLIFSGANAQQKSPPVYLNTPIFLGDDGKALVEVHLKIPLQSVVFKKNKDGMYEGGKFIKIESLGSGNLVADSFNLQAPPMADTLNKSFDLLVLRRYSLQGIHFLQIKITDLNLPARSFSFTHKVVANIPEKLMSFSDIMLVDSVFTSAEATDFKRGNFNFLPKVSNQFVDAKKKLVFYAELYHAADYLTSENLTIHAEIKDSNKKSVAGFIKDISRKTDNKIAFFNGFDIGGLNNGVYSLSLQFLNESKMALAQKEVYFVVAKASDSKDTFTYKISHKTLKEYIEFVDIISSPIEKGEFKKLSKAKDSIQLKIAFFSFWKKRNETNPKDAFDNYESLLKYVKENFSYGKIRGFKTDRGKVVLKYGKPDFISPYADEPAAYPYEIWQYYHMQNQTNVRFIFYDPTATQFNYQLLHSDLNGERHSPDWKYYVYRRVKRLGKEDKDAYGNDADKRVKE
ncbi:MAG: GWxTD domain-containing protein [Bacteroidetes bacterium]|nr:GWxTD domain-containing protein [Bacteroidota bacterium]